MWRKILSKRSYMCFFSPLQINWLNVITLKSFQRQKAVILVMFPQLDINLSFWTKLPERKCQSNCLLIDFCCLVRSMSLKRKINSHNSSPFKKPLLTAYNIPGAVAYDTSFSYCVLNDTGPIFRKVVTASFTGLWSMPSDRVPYSEGGLLGFNAQKDPTALLLSSWNSERGPTNHTACVTPGELVVGLMRLPRLDSETWL